MSINFNFGSSSQRALDTAIMGCVRDAVEFLAMKYGFSAEDALAEMQLTKATPVKKPPKTKVVKPSIPLPFCGTLLPTCYGIRVNHMLYTQCPNEKMRGEDGEELDYCKTCAKSGYSNDIRARLSGEWSPPKGKIVNYGNVMEKLNITREVAVAEAAKLGLTIPEEQFTVVKGRRGRPKSDAATSSSDDEKPKKPRGRPKKSKKVIDSSAGDDLISQLCAAAQAESTDSSSENESVVSISEKKAKAEAREAEKKAKAEAREAEKKAKAEAREAEKKAKAEAREAEKKAKAEARQQTKMAEEQLTKVENEAMEEAEKMMEELTLVENEAMEEKELQEESLEEESEEDDDETEPVHLKEINGKKYLMLLDGTNALCSMDGTRLGKYYDESEGTIKELDSESDDDMDVEEIEIEGTKYLVDDDGNIYDKDTHQPTGQYYDSANNTIKQIEE